MKGNEKSMRILGKGFTGSLEKVPMDSWIPGVNPVGPSGSMKRVPLDSWIPGMNPVGPSGSLEKVPLDSWILWLLGSKDPGTSKPKDTEGTKIPRLQASRLENKRFFL